MKRPADWTTLRGVRLMLDRHACVNCGAPCPHPRHHDVDHIVPLKFERNPHRAGAMANCRPCHRDRGAA